MKMKTKNAGLKYIGLLVAIVFCNVESRSIKRPPISLLPSFPLATAITGKNLDISYLSNLQPPCELTIDLPTLYPPCGCLDAPNCGCNTPKCGCSTPKCGCNTPNCGCNTPKCGCNTPKCGFNSLSCGCIDVCSCAKPALNDCGCANPCNCNVDIIDFAYIPLTLPSQLDPVVVSLTPAIDTGCGYSNCNCGLCSYGYVPSCGCGLPNCRCGLSNCGCGFPNCGCELNTYAVASYVPNCGCGQQNCGCGLPNCGCGLPNCGCGLPNCGCGLPNYGCGLPNCLCGLPNCGCGLQNCGCDLYPLPSYPSYFGAPNCACAPVCGCGLPGCDCLAPSPGFAPLAPVIGCPQYLRQVVIPPPCL